jgi:hypothetical protein
MKDSNGLSEKVSNLAYLTELSKGNTQFVTEMIDIFLAENPAEVETLELAIAESDYEQIQSISHHMRSTMPFIGLDVHISKDLTETEQFAKSRSELPEIKIRFVKIKRICNLAVEELRG